MTARYVLDTNVISEIGKLQPDPSLLTWIRHLSIDLLFVSVISLGEMVRGAERLPRGRRRTLLMEWIERDMERLFDGRILGFDKPTAMLWGHLMGMHDRAGTPRAAVDMQIAATAIYHGMTLATRNTRDFAGTGVSLVNPWTA